MFKNPLDTKENRKQIKTMRKNVLKKMKMGTAQGNSKASDHSYAVGSGTHIVNQ